MNLLKSILTILLCTAALLFSVFLIGRYGWKLLGFHTCESAGIEYVNVEEDSFSKEAEATENGIYVRLERDDAYSVDWYFENQSGGMANADGTALEVGKNIYLDKDIFFTAANLERPVPVMLTFSDKDGTPIARTNTSFDSQSPVLIVTLTVDARILLNGVEAEAPAVPTVYENILSRYRTALEENWDGQQLTDAGLNLMVRDVASETVGYAVDDLDDNGIPELAIGTVSGDDFYGKLILDLYTVDIVTTLKLEGEGLVDMTFATDPAEYVQMELVPVVKPNKE